VLVGSLTGRTTVVCVFFFKKLRCEVRINSISSAYQSLRKKNKKNHFPKNTLKVQPLEMVEIK
jgi:hypothetical protein